jgi:hypothetical protein
MNILNKIKKYFFRIDNYDNNIINNLIDLKIIAAKKLIEINSNKNSLSINEYEFKVFSQFGEDGIIDFLVKKTKIEKEEKNFIEIGVGDYTECNSKFLLMNSYWSGIAIEGNKSFIKKIKTSEICWKYGLKIINLWIKKDNIEKIILENTKKNKIGLLSIDIDGNDYWIWKEIKNIKPVIVVIEWNSLFGKLKKLTVPYDDNFIREEKHYSGQYWGASISALKDIGKKNGYSLVGSNSAGNNLFFVRNDRMNNLLEKTTEDVYTKKIFVDSRDKNKRLNFLSEKEQLKEIENLNLVDLDTNQLIKISNIKLDM